MESGRLGADPGDELGDFRVVAEGVDGGVGIGELFFGKDGVTVAVASAAEERYAVEALVAVELAARPGFGVAGARDEVVPGQGKALTFA